MRLKVLVTIFLALLLGLLIRLSILMPLLSRPVLATQAVKACTSGVKDIMLIIDDSGSMGDPAITGGSVSKMSQTQEAAKTFVDIVSNNFNNRVGVMTVDGTATLFTGFSTNYPAIKTDIDSITSDHTHTCIQCGIKATDQLATSLHFNYAILITDGAANWIDSWDPTLPESYNDPSVGIPAALDAASQAYADNQIHFYTIGIRSQGTGKFLTSMAQSTNAKDYFDPNATQLNQIYSDIANEISCEPTPTPTMSFPTPILTSSTPPSGSSNPPDRTCPSNWYYLKSSPM